VVVLLFIIAAIRQRIRAVAMLFYICKISGFDKRCKLLKHLLSSHIQLGSSTKRSLLPRYFERYYRWHEIKSYKLSAMVSVNKMFTIDFIEICEFVPKYLRGHTAMMEKQRHLLGS
jgi:hypothetical protein